MLRSRDESLPLHSASRDNFWTYMSAIGKTARRLHLTEHGNGAPRHPIDGSHAFVPKRPYSVLQAGGMSHSTSSNGSHEPGAAGARPDRDSSTPSDSPADGAALNSPESGDDANLGEGAESRRGFLAQAATASMAVGMVASYGTLAAYAGKFLFTMQDDRALLFVAAAHEIAPGESRSFESPTGVRVTVTRKASAASLDSATGPSSAANPAAGPGREPAADEFLALSSVCPHLGCRVHWESVNNRFFCPCHNGEFDPEGRATGGPPKAANQELPRYRVVIDKGLVFLEMPLNTVGADRSTFLKRV